MVIGIEADIIEIVVFAASADAFLGIGGSGIACGNGTGPFTEIGLACPEKEGDELIHARVGEEEVWGIWEE